MARVNRAEKRALGFLRALARISDNRTVGRDLTNAIEESVEAGDDLLQSLFNDKARPFLDVQPSSEAARDAVNLGFKRAAKKHGARMVVASLLCGFR